MLFDLKTKKLKELNKKQFSLLKKKARLALRDIESRYDIKHGESLKIAIEGGVNVNSIVISLRGLLKADEEDPFYYSNNISLSNLLHYDGDSRAINDLINNFGVYFSEYIKNESLGINVDTTSMDYFLQLKIKKLESMGINPENLIH